jgi:hypothetical protein
MTAAERSRRRPDEDADLDVVVGVAAPTPKRALPTSKRR